MATKASKAILRNRQSPLSLKRIGSSKSYRLSRRARLRWQRNKVKQSMRDGKPAPRFKGCGIFD